MNRRHFLKAGILSPVSGVLASHATAGIESTVTASLPIPPPFTDLSLLLDCIAQVESGRKDDAEGKRGYQVTARGRYQLSSDVWFQHTNRPWKLAHNYFVATEIAQRHMGWLDVNLPKIAIDEYHFRPYSLAWCWRGGLDGWRVRSTFPEEVVHQYDDYANRVINLYKEIRK